MPFFNHDLGVSDTQQIKPHIPHPAINAETKTTVQQHGAMGARMTTIDMNNFFTAVIDVLERELYRVSQTRRCVQPDGAVKHTLPAARRRPGAVFTQSCHRDIHQPALLLKTGSLNIGVRSGTCSRLTGGNRLLQDWSAGHKHLWAWV